MEQNHFRPGQFNYPTRNFATLGSYPPCRHEDWTISSSRWRDVRRMASEDSHQIDESFLLIFCTGRIVTARVSRYRQIHQVFQQMAECVTTPLPEWEAAFHLRTVHSCYSLNANALRWLDSNSSSHDRP